MTLLEKAVSLIEYLRTLKVIKEGDDFKFSHYGDSIALTIILHRSDNDTIEDPKTIEDAKNIEKAKKIENAKNIKDAKTIVNAIREYFSCEGSYIDYLSNIDGPYACKNRIYCQINRI